MIQDLGSLRDRLARRIVGQDDVIDAIVPFVEMHQSGLAPDGRPIGVVMMLGPTGTGKTRTVEALAEVLHFSSRNLLKIDCGEFQMEHEVAKLIGAPPGYLGHRETQPMLSQAKLNSVASESSDISIVLFDEIEKAAPSMSRILLGILDKATLRLGDNTSVSFQRSLIFLTSNLGARAMQRAMNPTFGLARALPASEERRDKVLRNIQASGISAVKRKFTPEFVNRIDSVVAFRPLDRPAFEAILDHIYAEHQRLISQRLGIRAFEIGRTRKGHDLLIERGTSAEFGARELKRTVQRHFVQPVAAMYARGEIAPGCRVILDARNDDFRISIKAALQ